MKPQTDRIGRRERRRYAANRSCEADVSAMAALGAARELSGRTSTANIRHYTMAVNLINCILYIDQMGKSAIDECDSGGSASPGARYFN
jgi:hypothetical protein